MTLEQKEEYLSTTKDRGNKRLDFRFAHVSREDHLRVDQVLIGSSDGTWTAPPYQPEIARLHICYLFVSIRPSFQMYPALVGVMWHGPHLKCQANIYMHPLLTA